MSQCSAQNGLTYKYRVIAKKWAHVSLLRITVGIALISNKCKILMIKKRTNKYDNCIVYKYKIVQLFKQFCLTYKYIAESACTAPIKWTFRELKHYTL